MSINSYKLVPVKMFEDLTKNRQSPVENNRSIKSIIEESNQKYSTPSLESIIENNSWGREGNWDPVPCGFMTIKLLCLTIPKEKK